MLYYVEVVLYATCNAADLHDAAFALACSTCNIKNTNFLLFVYETLFYILCLVNRNVQGLMKIIGQLLQIETDQRDRNVIFTCAYSIRSVTCLLQLVQLLNLPELCRPGRSRSSSRGPSGRGFRPTRWKNTFTCCLF